MCYSSDQGGALSFLNIIPQSSSELVFQGNLNLTSEGKSPVSDVDLRFRTGWNFKLAAVVWRILEFGIELPFSSTSRWFETLISRLHLPRTSPPLPPLLLLLKTPLLLLLWLLWDCTECCCLDQPLLPICRLPCTTSTAATNADALHCCCCYYSATTAAVVQALMRVTAFSLSLPPRASCPPPLSLESPPPPRLKPRHPLIGFPASSICSSVTIHLYLQRTFAKHSTSMAWLHWISSNVLGVWYFLCPG